MCMSERLRHRREEALEVPRGRLGRRVPGFGVRGAGAHELPRAPRLERHVTLTSSSSGSAWKGVGSSPATFDYAKLEWLNGQYLRAMSAEEYGNALSACLCGSMGDGHCRVAPLCQDLERSASSRRSRGSSSAGPPGPHPAHGGLGPPPRAGRGGNLGLGRPLGSSKISGRPTARPETAAGAPADPDRDHRLTGLAGALPVDRAARSRGGSRANRGGLEARYLMRSRRAARRARTRFVS